MVEEAFHAARIGRRVGETVTGAAIELQPPVHTGTLHFGLEGRALLGRNDRIVGADAHQHLGLDVHRILRPCRREAGMKTDDRLHIGAAARDLQRGRAAEAVSDGGEPSGIDFLLALEDVERRQRAGTDARRIGHPGLQPRHRLAEIGQWLAVAVIVHGEGGVAEARQARRDLLGVVGEARPLVAHQHAATLARLAVVDHILADHADAVGAVLDILGAHRRSFPLLLAGRLAEPA